VNELADGIEDPDVLLGLSPEELGGRILFIVRRRQASHRSHGAPDFSPHNLTLEFWQSFSLPPTYQQKREEIDLAFGEAWGWLQAQGLIVSLANIGKSPGWFRLSRRALAFENVTDFSRFAMAARVLPKDQLHPRVANPVWMAFMRGEFDVAVFQAMKAVEVAVREASGLPSGLLGVALMRKAFDPENGPLADLQAEKGEREARSALFAGAIGSYKNPQSHRDVQLDNPTEAMEIIMIANHLLRIVDARSGSQTSGSTAEVT